MVTWKQFQVRLKDEGVHSVLMVSDLTKEGVFHVYLTDESNFQRENVKKLLNMPEVVNVEKDEGTTGMFTVTTR